MGAVASGARSQSFFGQFRGLFKEFGAKRCGRAAPLWIRAWFYTRCWRGDAELYTLCHASCLAVGLPTCDYVLGYTVT